MVDNTNVDITEDVGAAEVTSDSAVQASQISLPGGATAHGGTVAFNPRSLGGLQPGDGE